MIASVYDPCFMYTENCMTGMNSESVPRGAVCLQTDDTAYVCNEAFSQLEEQICKKFDSKAAKFSNESDKVKFNGAMIGLCGDTYYLTQPHHIEKLKQLDTSTASKEEFVEERARGAYIAAVCRPDA